MVGGDARDRVQWAVTHLDVHPDDRILEIGSGGGTAVAAVCPLLTPGRGQIMAIDRSATAVKRTAARNAAYVDDGRAVVRAAGFTEADLADVPDAAFDKIFSVNVNLFWTGPAVEELGLIRRLLAPDGAMFACWGRGPTPGRSDEIAARVAARFREAGFETSVASDTGLQCVTARPSPP